MIELMIAVAILVVIAGIAIPLYTGYIREARLGTARTNMESLRIYLEDWRLDNGDYDVTGTGSFDPETSAVAGWDWDPEGDQNAYRYSVTAGTNSFGVLVEWDQDPNIWVLCQNRMSNCCDNETTGATKSNCP